MDCARVALFEDEPYARESLQDYLEVHTEHRVVANAVNPEEAKQVLDDIKAGDLEVDCIISDGMGFIVGVIGHMQAIGLRVPVIGASSFSMKFFGVQDKVYVDTGKNASAIARALDQL